jgi:hypothetical protein
MGVACLICTLAVFAAPRAIAAESERSLDPVLSLIGGCSGKAEPLDPVEDPGCPTTTPPASAHPAEQFAAPTAVATDSYGNIYVSNFGKDSEGTEGRIDIFGPDGVFISELRTTGPRAIAVDSLGNLYVRAETSTGIVPILRFAPVPPYEPEAGNIEYVDSPVSVTKGTNESSEYAGLAINPEDDHLFANFGAGGLQEFSSVAEGNERVSNTTLGTWPFGVGVAIDHSRGLLYASALEDRVDIFDLTTLVGSPPSGEYEKVGTIEGSKVPAGSFGGDLSVAVDEATGHVFVFDGEVSKLYEFDEAGNYVSTLEHGFQAARGTEIVIDNGSSSPNGALSTVGRYLYVPSGKTGVGHSFAFNEASTRAPEVVSTGVSGITESEAEFQATINPGNLETSYIFEYTTEQRFEEEEWNGASLAGSGKLPAGNLDDEASAAVDGLQDGTSYRFRVVVTNGEGTDGAEGSFSTYPSDGAEPSPCVNHLLRTGFSVALPDCRAYELVTPPDTNARAPLGTGHEGGIFTNRQVSPAGDKVPFRVEGGAIPGIGGTGSYLGDPYVSTRAPDGWSTAYIGPTGSEATSLQPGTTSPDQGYSFWVAQGTGSAVLGQITSYVRYPDGHSELLGHGSIGDDPEALGQLISEGGDHIIFSTGVGASPDPAVQLEPDAAPAVEVEVEGKIVRKGTRAIYDRTSDGVLHVISLLPGGIPLGAGEHATFYGASLDGKGVAFMVADRLYLRYQDSETFEIGEGVDFAGVAEGGSRVFYVEGGKLWRFDALTGERTPFSSGAVTPVNVSADGSTAYFVSTAVLTKEGNPNGAKAKVGKRNLYLSDEGAVSFVGTVTDRDVEGAAGGTETVDGLGLWVSAVGAPAPGRLSVDPSRTTPDGSVLLFKSRAALGDYDPEGHAQIYRYDSTADELQCLSCNPTGVAATSDATLQSETREGGALFYPQAWLANLSSDGGRAFFESSEALVAADADGRQDVYEWENQGLGSCNRAGGCFYLISSGHSSRNDYLWAVSESGNDVFFLTSDLLLPADVDETPSIYDARVDGGFPESSESDCQGEGCRPQLTPPPALPGAQTPVHGKGENFKPRRCGKGKRKLRRGGKVRCVKKHRRHQAGTNPKGGRK